MTHQLGLKDTEQPPIKTEKRELLPDLCPAICLQATGKLQFTSISVQSHILYAVTDKELSHMGPQLSAEAQHEENQRAWELQRDGAKSTVKIVTKQNNYAV